MRDPPIITLLSDFGLRDPYVAEMKAVILSICPKASIVDISHNIRKYDVRMGAFILARATPYFPNRTIHVAVVDPGVGTARRPIIIETKRSTCVGPDNGLLMLSAQKEGISHIYNIANSKYTLKQVSRTFHGRDIFSPVAAYLARGVPPSEFGPEISDLVKPSFLEPKIEPGRIEGEAIYIDDFGNIVTNIDSENLKKIGVKEGNKIAMKIGGKETALILCRAYGEAALNVPLAIIGSSGFLEVSVNQGDASRVFKVAEGAKVIIRSELTEKDSRVQT